MRIRAWEMTSEVDDKGVIKLLHKHAFVTLKWTGITKMVLRDFNHQNVLFDIRFFDSDDGIHTILDTSYGLNGEIVSSEVQVEPIEVTIGCYRNMSPRWGFCVIICH
ncbi:TPA: hypothetical protein EYP66_02215 [Candidatus Poribacteria bacterium]|nr:hypothetical protein [Candidatus Poribacteria bacterium]